MPAVVADRGMTSRSRASWRTRHEGAKTDIPDCIVSSTSRIFSAVGPAATALNGGNHFNAGRRTVLIGGHSRNHGRMPMPYRLRYLSGQNGVRSSQSLLPLTRKNLYPALVRVPEPIGSFTVKGYRTCVLFETKRAITSPSEILDVLICAGIPT
jgi:hypothetical protein